MKMQYAMFICVSLSQHFAVQKYCFRALSFHIEMTWATKCKIVKILSPPLFVNLLLCKIGELRFLIN